MRHFAYLGDHAAVTLYGVTFAQGEPTPVNDPFLIQKLEGNSHFAEAPAPKTKKAKPTEPADSGDLV